MAKGIGLVGYGTNSGDYLGNFTGSPETKGAGTHGAA